MDSNTLTFSAGLGVIALSKQIIDKIPNHKLTSEELQEIDFDVAAVDRMQLRILMGDKECNLARQRIFVKVSALLNEARKRP